jgi:glycosyltransferase involved in cell wall biosynthesis
MLTYNHERYLAESIEGVIRQETSFPVELLIGEDCSIDGTRSIALGYQERFPEMIRVITSESNVGMHKNGARLTKAARGKYIAFCEGDDFWHRSDKLSRQIAVLEADSTVSMVCSDYRDVSDAGCVISEKHERSEIGDSISYDDLVVGGGVIYTPTVCARTSLIKRVQVESPQCHDFSLLMGDLPLWLEMSQCGRIKYLHEPLASYRRSINSASRKDDPIWELKFRLSAYEVLCQFLEKYPLQAGSPHTERQYVKLIRRQLKCAAVVGDVQSAKRQAERMKKHNIERNALDRFLCLVVNLPLDRGLILRVARAIYHAGRRTKRLFQPA